MRHLAIIMDGNRRWAQSQGMEPWAGHAHGLKAVERAIQFCLKRQIPYLSLYTFSIENFKRPELEKSYLFDLLLEKANSLKDKANEDDICLKFIGDRSLFPAKVIDAINSLEEQTKNSKRLQINFLFCYGSRQEIVESVKKVAQQVKSGQLDANEITEETIARYLWTAGIPEPDLIIRTGGARRISNFLLFQAAYSELYFLDCFWPEVTEDHLQLACQNFQQCQRNFGV